MTTPIGSSDGEREAPRAWACLAAVQWVKYKSGPGPCHKHCGKAECVSTSLEKSPVAFGELAPEAISAALNSLQKLVHDYVEDYELDDGEHCSYAPNEQEATLIMDAIQGLLADQEIIDTFNAWQDLARRDRAALSYGWSVLTDEQIDRVWEFLPGVIQPSKTVFREYAKRLFAALSSDREMAPEAEPK